MKIKRVVIFSVLFTFILLSIPVLTETPVSAQESQNEPSPEEMMEAMGPMMGNMMTNMLEMTLAVMAKPETAKRLATFTKNYYDALVAKGFSKEDALRIVTATGVPSLSR